MNKNKSNIICAVICIAITLALVGGAIIGVVSNSNNNEAEKHNTEENTNDDKMQTPDGTDGNKESENTSGDFTDIPSLRDDPRLPDVQGEPNIDVGEMTKNPEAEVVDSKIEYGTKEADSNEK